uniref:Uncharacterized protein n=1 Tax=Arundo donax TaxID=35708 RepID=A0A0A9DJA1_ARUDO
MPPPAQERWGILAGIPKVVQYKEAKCIFPPGTDISVAYNELPRASVLTVPLHISFPRSIEFYPHIAAADRSGLLLLCSTHTIATSCSMVSYHICDARTGEVVSLCGHSGPMGIHGANVGLIVRGDGCVVAELQPGCDGPGSATLLCYKVGGVQVGREGAHLLTPAPAALVRRGRRLPRRDALVDRPLLRPPRLRSLRRRAEAAFRSAPTGPRRASC